MTSLNVFFPTKYLRDNYLKKILKIEEKTNKKNEWYAFTDGIRSIHFKYRHKKVPGYWISIKFEDEGYGKFIWHKICEMVPSFWIDKYLFFPKEVTSKKRMEELWIQKYNLSQESYNSNAWKIFYREAKKHVEEGRIDVAKTALLCIYKYNPFFLKKYKRYYLFEDLAYSYKASGELHKSIQCLKVQARLQSDSIEAYLNMSSFLFLAGLYEEAIDVCKKGLQIHPNDQYLINNLIISYIKGQYFEDALVYLQSIVKKEPHVSMYWKLMGDVFLQVDKTKLAIICYQKSLAISSEEIEAVKEDIYYGLAVCYYCVGLFTKSARYYHKVLGYNETDGTVLLSLSKLYREKLKDYTQAKIYAKKFVTLYLESGYGHYSLGLAYLYEKNFDKAKWHLYKARKIIPDYRPIHEAISKLKQSNHS